MSYNTNEIRMNLVDAVLNHRWDMAMHYIHQLNEKLPLQYRVNIPKLNPITANPDDAMSQCFEYGPKVEQTHSNFRQYQRSVHHG